MKLLTGLGYASAFFLTLVYFSGCAAGVNGSNHAASPAETWVIDTEDSSIKFAFRQEGHPPRWGSSRRVHGVLDFPTNASAGNMLVTLDADSLMHISDEVKYDVSNDRGLDLDQHPTITFRSDQVVRSETGFTATGVLSLNGIDEPARFELMRMQDQNGKPAHLVQTTFTPDRFAMAPLNAADLSNERIEFQAILAWEKIGFNP